MHICISSLNSNPSKQIANVYLYCFINDTITLILKKKKNIKIYINI